MIKIKKSRLSFYLNLFRSGNKSRPIKNGKPPRSLVLIFGIFFVIASLNVFKSVGGSFDLGGVNKVLAEIGVVRPASNVGEIVTALKGDNTEAIEDSFDRCNVIDPNVGITQVKNLNETDMIAPLGANAGGTNLAPDLSQGDGHDIVDIANNYGNSYVLGMATSPSASANTIAFIEYANSLNIIPIIRLCYPDSCGFSLKDNADSVINFYKDISNAVGTNKFIAGLGPNEPGTAGEMEAFGVSTGDYGTLVNRANEAAIALQQQRAVNGGNMYLSPASAFNLTNGENDDAQQYLTNSNFNAELYDYILGNAYNVGGRDIYSFYTQTGGNYNVKNYVDSHNLKMIFTEIGDYTANVSLMKQTLTQACADPGVDGFLFFRSYGEYAGLEPDPHPGFFSRSQIEDILSVCPSSKKTETTARDNAWVSCSYDSCLYDDQYSDASSAKTCGVQAASNSTSSTAELVIACNGNSCNAKKIDTVTVAAPIKQFASNSATGTTEHPYTPLCVEIARNLGGDSKYDALNQFAGALTSKSGGESYPMPWLGSGLNCAAYLLKSDFNLNSTTDANFTPSDGSLSSQSEEEKTSEASASTTIEGVDINGSVSGIIDEKRICLNGNCIEKGASDTEVASWNTYDYINTPDNYVAPKVCSSTNMTYLRDPNNYIIGPELELNEGKTTTVWSGSGNDLCFSYAKRNASTDYYSDSNNGLDPLTKLSAPSNLSCTVNASDTTLIPALGLSCGVLASSGYITCADGRALTPETATEIMQSGTCLVNPIYKSCLTYNYDASNPAYYKTSDYAAAPSYDIPGAYDALYNEYERIQNKLTQRGLKIVFSDNLGWKLDVSTNVRDANRTVGGSGPTTQISSKVDYGYDQSLSMCTVSENLFDNEYYLAKGTSSKTTYEYYDWLGYLDLIQEWMQQYVNDNTFSAEKLVDNPYKDTTDLKDENGKFPEQLENKDLILESGLAGLSTSYPLLSCDDVAIRKYDPATSDDLKIDVDSVTTCVTTLTDDVAQDELGCFLKSKGYDVDVSCDFDEDTETDDNLQCVETETFVGSYDFVTCPIPGANACFQGPYGTYSHCAVQGTLPIDLYPGYVTSDDSNRDFTVVAPESGTVERIQDNGVQGYEILIQGAKSGIYYRMLHLESGLPAVGTQVRLGQNIGKICTTTCTYGYDNAHTHLEGYTTYSGGKLSGPIDPYLLYGEILGCNAVAPSDDQVNGTTAKPGQCFTATGNKLQDNEMSCKATKVTAVDDSIVIEKYNAADSNKTDDSFVVSQDEDLTCTAVPDPTDRDSDKEYGGIDCLINDIAEYINTNVVDGIPAEMLKATLIRETGGRVDRNNTNLLSGDPAQISYNYENGAGAMGSMQFTKGAWMDSPSLNIVNRYKTELLGCVHHIGLTSVTDITYSDRAVVGISICAAALKHIDDVKSDPAYGGLGKVVPAAQWDESTVRAAAYNYYGACAWTVGGNSGNYCVEVWNLFNGFKTKKTFENLDCSANAGQDIETPNPTNPSENDVAVTQCKSETGVQASSVLSVPGYTVNTSHMQEITNLRKNLTCDANVDELVENPIGVVLHWTAGRPFTDRQGTLSSMTTTPITSNGVTYLHPSAQFFVSVEGEIYQIAPTPNYFENHSTGLSWKTIGIENEGAKASDLTDAQVKANAALIKALKAKFSSIKFLVGHDQVDNIAYTDDYPDIKAYIASNRLQGGIGCKGDVGYDFLNKVGKEVGLTYYNVPYTCVQP